MPRGISVGPGFDWTEARVAEAIRLWTEGLTLRQIGQALGCSRNAVLGKIHRLAAKQDASGAPLYPGLVKREVRTPGFSRFGEPWRSAFAFRPSAALPGRRGRSSGRPCSGPLHPGTDGDARAYAAAPAPLAPARRAVSKADRQFAGAL